MSKVITSETMQGLLSLIHQDISNKADSEHTHEVSKINGLQDKLDNKADSTHTHLVNDITDMEDMTTSDVETVWNSIEGADIGVASHTHTISDVNDLQTTLDGKANSTHTHSISDITNLQTTINNKVSSTQVTNIVTLSQSEYDALSTKNSSTLYIII